MLIIHPLMNWQRQHIPLQPTSIRELIPIYSVTMEASPPGESRNATCLQEFNASITVGDEQRQRKRTDPLGQLVKECFQAKDAGDSAGEP